MQITTCLIWTSGFFFNQNELLFLDIVDVLIKKKHKTIALTWIDCENDDCAYDGNGTYDDAVNVLVFESTPLMDSGCIHWNRIEKRIKNYIQKKNSKLFLLVSMPGHWYVFGNFGRIWGLLKGIFHLSKKKIL